MSNHKNPDIWGAFSRQDKLTTEDFEMLAAAEKEISSEYWRTLI
jgi:hypothetical protein